MARCLRVLALAACVALPMVLLAGGSVKAEEKKVVTGTVEVSTDDEGAVTGVSVSTADGKVKLALDEKSRKLASELNGKKAEVSGTVGDDGVMKVDGYKEVKEAPAEELEL